MAARRVRKSENLLEWENKVEGWRIKYGNATNSTHVRTFDPTSISIVRVCSKCNASRKKMSRHHLGHEYLFACLMEERYAARYIQFHPSDVRWLCNRCHIRAHVVIEKIVREVWEYVNRCQEYGKPYDYEKLESLRKRLVRASERWLAYKKKRKRKRSKIETTTRERIRKLKSHDYSNIKDSSQ